jgi:hypothetical protein
MHRAQGTSQDPVVISDSPEPSSPERRRSSGPTQHSGQAPPTWDEHPSWNTTESNEHNQGQSSRNEGNEHNQGQFGHNEGSGSGGFTGWVRSHFGGS